MCSPYELDLEEHIDKSTRSAIVAWAKIAIGVNPMFRIISERMTRRLQFETPNIWSTWTHLNEPRWLLACQLLNISLWFSSSCGGLSG